MAAKMIVLALCVVAVMGGALPEAARYPAGVDPNVCPNYPNCDNVALAYRSTGSAPYAAPYAAPTYNSYGHQGGVPGSAASYPAGVDSNVCPNYPYCGPTPVQTHSAPAYNSWSAPAAQPSWNAPAAPQPSWNARNSQNTWSNAGGSGFWSNPSAPGNAVPQNWNSPAAPTSYSNWNAPAPQAASHDQGGARYPAGVDPNFCPNYPYCN